MSPWDIFRWRTLAGGRWCPVGTVQRSVSAAASVGAGRLPLADSTRGGSRDAGAVRRLRGQAASLTGRSRGYRPCGRVRPGR